MSYIDGFVLAVPTANKQKFIDHAHAGDSVFVEYGASRVLECWGDDVPDGKQTDFRRAVQAKDDETVVFSWIEWPDKETRDAGMEKMMKDPRMDPATNPMPFDGKRLICGGWSPVLELVAGTLLAFVIALGEYVASVLVFVPANRPISIAIASELRDFNLGAAAAYGVVLVVIISISMVVAGKLERLRT